MRIQRDPIPFDEAGWRFEWADPQLPAATQRLAAMDADNNVLAEIIAMNMPDRSVSVVFSAGGTAPDSVTGLAEYMLLRDVVSQAVAHNARFVRCVLASRDARGRADSLRRAGFHAAVTISQQSVPVCLLADRADHYVPWANANTLRRPETVKKISFDALDARNVPEHLKSDLERVLDESMKHSSDAAGFPRSTGREMLWLWSLLNVDVTLTVTRCDGAVGGLIVTGLDPGVTTGSPMATVEYIGLLPEYRGCGIAARLLTRAAEDLSRRPEYDSEMLMITHVDVDNHAALKFYARNGFLEEDKTTVWVFLPH